MGMLTEIENVKYSFMFAENKWKFVVSVFRSQQANGSFCFPLIPFLYVQYIYIEIAAYKLIYGRLAIYGVKLT